MTDDDCPVRDDATVILVDSLERVCFSIIDSYVCVYVCAAYKIILPFPLDDAALFLDTVDRAHRVFVKDQSSMQNSNM